MSMLMCMQFLLRGLPILSVVKFLLIFCEDSSDRYTGRVWATYQFPYSCYVSILFALLHTPRRQEMSEVGTVKLSQ